MKDRNYAFDANSNNLFEAIMCLKNTMECEQFFSDVLTISELQAITERFCVAKLLYKKTKSYRMINDETGVSTATITRIAQWMKSGAGGYNLVLKRLFKKK